MSLGKAEGDKLYANGEYDKAISCYSQLIAIYEKDTSDNKIDEAELALLYNDRGHAKYMMVDFYPARDDYDKAIELNPKLDVAYYNRATINYRMGDFTLALQDFSICTKLNPDNSEYREGLESCHSELRNM